MNDSVEDNHENILKSQIEDELRDTNDEISEEHKELSPILQKVKEQVPSVFKLIQFIQEKLPKKKKHSLKEEVDIDGDTSEKIPKKKTKIKVIHVVFLVLFGLVLFSEEIIGPEETSKEVKTDKTTKNIKKQNNKKELKVTSNDDINIPINDSDPLMIGSEDVEPKEMIKPKIEKIEDVETEDITNLFKNEMNNPSDLNRDESLEVKDSELIDDTNIEDKTLNLKKDMALKKEKFDRERVEKSKKIVNSKLVDDESDDFLIEDLGIDDTSEDITKSIMKDLEKKIKIKRKETLVNRNNKDYDLLDIVNYDVPGRGLVYNCSDKHWACITVKSYSYCQNNYKFNLDEQKVIQCFPKAIYESDYDCEAEQLLKVSNSADTNFCN